MSHCTKVQSGDISIDDEIFNPGAERTLVLIRGTRFRALDKAGHAPTQSLAPIVVDEIKSFWRTL